MVGSAIVRSLERNGYHNIITRTHKELDLTRQDQVEKFFAEEKPDYVFLAAAKVGGIVANSEALADFMYDNMILEMNVIHEAWKNNCKKLLFLGSSCIYPRMAPQPMPESWHPLAEPFLRGCKAANRSAVSHCQATARTSKAAADLFLWQTKTVRNAVSARANARQVQYLPTIQKTTTTSSASAVCGACRSARRMRGASASL